MLAALALLACATAPPRETSAGEGPPMQDVQVTLGDGGDAVDITLAGAWVADDGSGHGVDATAVAAGPPQLVVTGDKSTWSLKDGVLVFEGHVQATRGDVVLYADRIEVHYTGDHIDTATATGSVRVVKGAREARGDRATMTTADGRVAIEGKPTLTEGAKRMSGDHIVLFLDDERLECDQCRLEVP